MMLSTAADEALGCVGGVLPAKIARPPGGNWFRGGADAPPPRTPVQTYRAPKKDVFWVSSACSLARTRIKSFQPI